MDRQQLFDSLDLNDHGLFHHEIYTISAIQPRPFIDERERSLTLDLQPALHQIETQTRLIG